MEHCEPEKKEPYGALTKRRRRAKRMSMQAVACGAGCGVARYARIESGAVEPSPDEREAISRALGIGRAEQ